MSRITWLVFKSDTKSGGWFLLFQSSRNGPATYDNWYETGRTHSPMPKRRGWRAIRGGTSSDSLVNGRRRGKLPAFDLW